MTPSATETGWLRRRGFFPGLLRLILVFFGAWLVVLAATMLGAVVGSVELTAVAIAAAVATVAWNMSVSRRAAGHG